MSVYVVAALTKTDPQAYEEYGRRGRDSLSAFENSRLAADDFAVLVEGEMPAPRFVLLRFDGPPLPALRLGDSGAVRDGQEVAITGFPLGASLGLVPVTHRGIVSAVTPVGMPAPSASQLDARTVRRLAMGAYNVFQLDLVSYPGNSGSPLFDTHSGEVVGILNMVFVKGTKESAVAMPTGISYAIPAHYLKALLAP